MGRCADICMSLLSYSTVKVVHINNWKLGTIHYSIQALIFLYVIGYVLFIDRGYQGQSPVVGYTATKVKGSAYQLIPGSGDDVLVWDSIDLINPPIENSALFVTTNLFATYQQTRGQWLDNTASCNDTNPCVAGRASEWGIELGPCVNETCMIEGWGPVEPEFNVTAASVLQDVADWTVFIRCWVLFSSYNIRENNIGDGLVANKNLFAIEDMLERAGTSYDDIAVDGAIIAVTIDWECAFDPWSRPCDAEITFSRLDDPSESFSKGFNYRYGHYYYLPEVSIEGSGENATVKTTTTEHRDLFKAYGIRFVFQVTGTGYKFSIVPLFVNIGSGLGLLVIATVVTDLIALYVFPQKSTYQHAKFDEVGDYVDDDNDDDYEEPTSGEVDYHDSLRKRTVPDATEEELPLNASGAGQSGSYSAV